MPGPAFLEPYLPLILVATLAVVVLHLGLTLFLALRVGRLSRRLDAITRGAEGASIEGILASHLRRVGELEAQVRDVEGRNEALEVRGRRAVQRVGLVRFNPFEDTGSNQSFSVAFLTDEQDGLVLSSLHSRQATRLYAKQIVRGRADTALSEEELEALRTAWESAEQGRAV